MSNHKIHISQHVIFYELDFPFAKSSIVQTPYYVSLSHCVIPLVVPSSSISSLLPPPLCPPLKLVPISNSSVSISFSKVTPIPTTQPLSSYVLTPCHLMIMHAKNDIFELKLFLSPTKTIFPPLCELNSFKETPKVPEWQ